MNPYRILSIGFFLLLASLTAPAALSWQRTNDPWLWSEEAQFSFTGSTFGSERAISVSLDGDTALVGCCYENGSGSKRGAAYVLVYDGSSWVQEARLVPGDPLDDALFGTSVAVHGDTALVGSPEDDDNGSRSGSAYVFVRSAGVWSEAAKLVAPDGAANDQFGFCVDLMGNAALVGAPYHDNPPGQVGGAAYVFTGSGTSWSLLQKLVASDVGSGFGASLALSGTTAVIGATGGKGVTTSTGAAFVFTKAGGAWHEQTKLYASDGEAHERFGTSVAVDGETALIGASWDDDAGSLTGSAYAFQRSGSTWTEVQKLLASDADPVTAKKFGNAVALEGETAMVGNLADYPHPDGLYVYRARGTRWVELEKHHEHGRFGQCLSISGNRALIGAPLIYPAETAFVFTRLLEPGFGYCSGDPGIDTPCPCSNDNDGSIPGSGCDNGAHPWGALLTAYGNPSVSEDELFLRTTHVEPVNSGLYFQGSLRVNGGAGVVFGDGLRCAGGQVKRLQVTFSDADGTSRTTIPLATKGEVQPGDLRWYQYWYRTTLAPPCGLWVNDFNTSNGYSITWVP